MLDFLSINNNFFKKNFILPRTQSRNVRCIVMLLIAQNQAIGGWNTKKKWSVFSVFSSSEQIVKLAFTKYFFIQY